MPILNDYFFQFLLNCLYLVGELCQCQLSLLRQEVLVHELSEGRVEIIQKCDFEIVVSMIPQTALLGAAIAAESTHSASRSPAEACGGVLTYRAERGCCGSAQFSPH